jgi:hypothetical protein
MPEDREKKQESSKAVEVGRAPLRGPSFSGGLRDGRALRDHFDAIAAPMAELVREVESNPERFQALEAADADAAQAIREMLDMSRRTLKTTNRFARIAFLLDTLSLFSWVALAALAASVSPWLSAPIAFLVSTLRAGGSGTLAVAVLGVLAACFGLYALRRRHRLLYGLVELAVGLAAVRNGLEALQGGRSDASAWLGLAGAAYLFIRGLDNVVVGRADGHARSEARARKWVSEDIPAEVPEIIRERIDKSLQRLRDFGDSRRQSPGE